MSTALSIPQAASVLTLDTPTLLEVIQTANSVITPYLEASESDFVDALQMQYKAIPANQYLYQLIKREEISDVCEFRNFYELNACFDISEKQKKDINRILNGKIPLSLTSLKLRELFEEKGVLQRYMDYKRKPFEDALIAKMEYVNLIPPNYRYPLALNEIYSYLVNFRAESWKEAVNLYEEQLHRWQLEANSEEALLLQAQTAALAGKAASSAGTAALFSGLSFFFK
ncbi:MAG: hypothetical protein FWD06_00945 [Oscillospiraceae bacterium]|nr:hypothetical protein [Oscillospiraceae bacterium]